MDFNAVSKFDEILFTLRLYKIGLFLHPGKSHALNDRSDSNSKILTLQSLQVMILHWQIRAEPASTYLLQLQ